MTTADYHEDVVFPVYLAKRFVENRGGVATERFGFLEIRRNGELLRLLEIVDDAVRYSTLYSVLGNF